MEIYLVNIKIYIKKLQNTHIHISNVHIYMHIYG